MLGNPVRNQLHGLDVYEQFENQQFLNVEAQASLRLGAESTVTSIAYWYDSNPALTEKQELATELFCSAHFDSPFRSRFLTLMTALEALLDYQVRSDAARMVVTDLQSVVANSALDEAEKQSLAGSLRWLHQESIGQAGKRIAATLLPTGTYGGHDAAKYFRKCYDLRSTIVHSGRVPDDVDLLDESNELHRFVGDLLHAAIGVPAA